MSIKSDSMTVVIQIIEMLLNERKTGTRDSIKFRGLLEDLAKINASGHPEIYPFYLHSFENGFPEEPCQDILLKFFENVCSASEVSYPVRVSLGGSDKVGLFFDANSADTFKANAKEHGLVVTNISANGIVLDGFSFVGVHTASTEYLEEKLMEARAVLRESSKT